MPKLDLTAEIQQGIQAFENKSFRTILHILYGENTTNGCDIYKVNSYTSHEELLLSFVKHLQGNSSGISWECTKKKRTENNLGTITSSRMDRMKHLHTGACRRRQRLVTYSDCRWLHRDSLTAQDQGYGMSSVSVKLNTWILYPSTCCCQSIIHLWDLGSCGNVVAITLACPPGDRESGFV